ncbi:hypothetical protein FAGKG844_20140 [Frankia sp. AgKG'84/4]
MSLKYHSRFCPEASGAAPAPCPQGPCVRCPARRRPAKVPECLGSADRSVRWRERATARAGGTGGASIPSKQEETWI